MAPPPLDPGECKAQAEDLDRFLHAMDTSGQRWNLDGVILAPRPELPDHDVDPAVGIIIGRQGIRVRGQTVDRGELKDKLDQALERFDAASQGGAHSRAAILMVDEAATWGDVVFVAETAASVGIGPLTLLFARPSPSRPPRASADDELDAVQRREPNTATAFAQVARQIASPCPSLVRAFGVAANADTLDKVNNLIDAVGPALVECSCRVDIASLRSLLWRLLANPTPVGLLEITLSRRGAKIAIPTATAWRDASKRLTPGATVWLVAQ
jgi:hypothetical protein